MTIIDINYFSDILMITSHAKVIIPDGEIPTGGFPAVFTLSSESSALRFLPELEERAQRERKAYVISTSSEPNSFTLERHMREELSKLMHDMFPLSETDIIFESPMEL